MREAGLIFIQTDKYAVYRLKKNPVTFTRCGLFKDHVHAASKKFWLRRPTFSSLI